MKTGTAVGVAVVAAETSIHSSMTVAVVAVVTSAGKSGSYWMNIAAAGVGVVVVVVAVAAAAVGKGIAGKMEWNTGHLWTVGSLEKGDCNSRLNGLVAVAAVVL